MEKIKVVFFFVLISTLLFAVNIYCASVNGTISGLKGKVEIKKAGEEKWVPATEGMTITKGTMIKTAAESSAMIKWLENNLVKVYELTIYNFKEADFNSATGDEKSHCFLEKGKIYAKAKKLKTAESEFKVMTPSAVAGVRGSEVMSEAVEGTKSSFSVLDGTFVVESAGVEQIVETGYQTEFAPGETPPPPQEIPPEIFKDLKQEAEQIKQEAGIVEKKDEKKDEKKEGKKDEKKEEGKKEEEKKDKEETKKDSPKQETKTPTETQQKLAETQPAPPTPPQIPMPSLDDTISNIVQTNINQAVEENTKANVVEQIQQQKLPTGSLEVNINVK